MRTALLRTLVLDVFTRVVDQGELADRALHRALRAHSELHSTERRLIATALYAMIRLYRRYDFLLDAALHGQKKKGVGALPSPDLQRLRYAVALMTELGETPDAAGRMADLPADLIGTLAALGRGPIAWPEDPTARLTVEESLPGWAAKRLLAEYGETAPALARALNVRAPLTLRANLLKATPEKLRDQLRAEGVESEHGRWSPWAVLLEGHHNVFGLKAYKSGLFEVQDEGSQLISLATGAAAKQTVIDACCGSGGKTLALAAMMENKGLIVACDVEERRMKDLRPRAALAGVFNLQPTIVPEGPAGEKPLKRWKNRAHVVLIDAPCSGSGAWRRHPDSRWRLKEPEIDSYAARQQQILARYAPCLRPGGLLVYATCSLFTAENDAVADAFATSHPDFVPEAIMGVPEAALDARGRLRLLPHVHGTDGFFAAAFRRKQPADSSQREP
jgi:16S rRNA (cytosine967-C5)-methyltransferase